MEIIALVILIIGMGGIFLVVFNIGKKNTKNTTKVKTQEIKTNNIKNSTKGKQTINGMKKGNNDIQKKDLFEFIEFEKIVDDMIIQEKESKFTMILQCKGINYDLMSEIEQLSIEEGFINFLNTLKSPIQLYVQARAIDLRTSLNMYKERVQEIGQEYSQKNDEYKKKLGDINATEVEIKEAELEKEKLANINEYASDITRYVERLSLNKHMLQRKFYVIISYYKSEITSTSSFNKNEIYDICRRELYTRAQAIISSLQSCSVSANLLSSNEIAELLYISYNRDDEKLMDIKSALDSGFYRMYSTSKDVQDKKDEVLKKEIHESAMRKIEIAINEAIEKGTLKTNDDFVEEYEQNVDIEAVKILQNSDMDDNTKKELQQTVVDNHNKEAEKRAKKREAKIEKTIEGNSDLQEKKGENTDDIDILSKEQKKIENDTNNNSEQDSIV